MSWLRKSNFAPWLNLGMHRIEGEEITKRGMADAEVKELKPWSFVWYYEVFGIMITTARFHHAHNRPMCGRGPLNGEPVYAWQTACDSDYVHTPYCPNFTCEDHDSHGADCDEFGMYHKRRGSLLILLLGRTLAIHTPPDRPIWWKLSRLSVRLEPCEEFSAASTNQEIRLGSGEEGYEWMWSF
ncbi:hypothetical protein F4778DRAFT_775590 [Xylariomycetidae sp. FL2044]|nr:hypothetical protein F4778DRAFT_775590 [Xylariomycetidae sp. FL2044]